MKILFLTSSYPRGPEDTASVFLRYLADYLSDSGVEMHILAPGDTGSGTTVEGKVTVHRFRYFPGKWQRLAYGSGMLPNLKRAPWLWFQVPFYVLSMAWLLLRLLATQRFHVIHSHWILPQGLVGLIGSLIFRVPLLVSAHGTDAFALRGRLTTGLKRVVLRGCAAWTANTASTAAALAAASLRSQARIVPMGVDVSLFSKGDPTALRGDLPDGDYLVLFVGRLIENKGCLDLIHALARFPDKIRARTALWVVGGGDRRECLEQAARAAGVAERVRFFGAVNHRRLPDFYAAADLAVIPSRPGTSGESEGQSLVVLEAFAARACVVATSIGGITSMVRNRETGILVEPADPIALSKAAEELLKNPELRCQISEKAHALVRERYSWDRIAAQFKELYREIILPLEA